jgi:hypothetical protein
MAIDKTNPVSRKDLYKAVTLSEMITEADALIDPETVPVMKPSWNLDEDGVALYDENDPGHFLCFKLIDLNKELKSSKPDSHFDDRLYFRHPLDVQYYMYPADIVTPPAPSTTTQSVASNIDEASSYAFSQIVKLENDTIS